MSNDSFLKEFKFFKENPKRTNKIDKDTGWVFGIFGLLGYIILLFCLGWENMIKYGMALTILFMFGCVATVAITIYVEKMNEPFEAFSRMIYSGNPADLFGDLSTPNMAEHLDDIKKDLKTYSGIRGNTAYYVWLRSNDPRIEAERKKSEEAHRTIAEIEKIQNNA